MKRPAIYSSGRQTALPPDPASAARANAPSHPTGDVHTPASASRSGRVNRWLKQQAGRPLAVWAALAAVTMLSVSGWWQASTQPPLTQHDIDQAVLHALNTQPLPSRVAQAYETILPSVVQVTGYVTHPKTGEQVEHGVGTGVVIVDTGIILTNLHVAAGAQTLRLTFHDGKESVARVIGTQPESDLAVLQAHEVPDDLQPATLISTADLRPGDAVAAVGFPFGIGPSVSAGVVSGLQRSFDAPNGKQSMDNLIQFDAAANPGNSGGPLINMEGEVVGIVTAIYNPTRQRTFIGIGFAVPIESAAGAIGLPPF